MDRKKPKWGCDCPEAHERLGTSCRRAVVRTFFGAAPGVPASSGHLSNSVDLSALIEAASRIAGEKPCVVAVDMPLAYSEIVGRRYANTAVSRAYGGRQCAAHSPTIERPGPISVSMRQQFETLGYPLSTRDISANTDRSLSTSCVGRTHRRTEATTLQDRSRTRLLPRAHSIVPQKYDCRRMGIDRGGAGTLCQWCQSVLAGPSGRQDEGLQGP